MADIMLHLQLARLEPDISTFEFGFFTTQRNPRVEISMTSICHVTHHMLIPFSIHNSKKSI